MVGCDWGGTQGPHAQALHRMREQLVKFRTAQIDSLRGLLTEYGEVMPQGRAGIKRVTALNLHRMT
jgi:transposase